MKQVPGTCFTDFELRSSLLTLGRVDASITLHSLNRNLGAILDVDATLGGLAVEFAAVDGVIHIFHLTSDIFHRFDSRHATARYVADGQDVVGITFPEFGALVGVKGFVGNVYLAAVGVVVEGEQS